MTNPTETMGDIIARLEKEVDRLNKILYQTDRLSQTEMLMEDERLREDNAALRAMLKRLEWSGHYEMYAICPVCEMQKESKHWPTCALAALLEGADDENA